MVRWIVSSRRESHGSGCRSDQWCMSHFLEDVIALLRQRNTCSLCSPVEACESLNTLDRAVHLTARDLTFAWGEYSGFYTLSSQQRNHSVSAHLLRLGGRIPGRFLQILLGGNVAGEPRSASLRRALRPHCEGFGILHAVFER